MKDPVEISIIIPVYNEEDNVVALYQEIIQVLTKHRLRFEVIFVNDGSTDTTGNRLQSIEAKAGDLRIVSHTKNFGQSASTFSGAKAAKYPLLVTLDGDGQNDPKDIVALVECYQEKRSAFEVQEKQKKAEGPSAVKAKPCVVFGVRSRREDTLWRILASRISNTIRQRLLKDQCSDTGCSLKVFPRAAFLGLPHFNHFHRYFPALFQRAGFEIVTVPVNHRPRQHGLSKYGIFDRLWSGIHDLIGVHWLIKRACSPEVLSDDK